MLKGNFLLLFVLLISGVSFAQDSINGKIYGNKAIAKFIKVSNTTNNTTTFSNENGNFSLKASVGDSVIFSSSFYEKKKIVVDNTHFSEILVIQLKDKINQLDEVVLKGGLSVKEFNPKEYNKELSILIKNDIKNNPSEYKPKPKSEYGVNLLGFIYYAKLLFPRKEKKNKKDKKNFSLGNISYYDLIKLNSNEEFFSDMFFTKDLKIPKDFKYIFFTYFDDQKISAELLSTEKRLLLIEKFYNVSKKFLNIINQATTPDNKTLNDSINIAYEKKDFD